MIYVFINLLMFTEYIVMNYNILFDLQNYHAIKILTS